MTTAMVTNSNSEFTLTIERHNLHSASSANKNTQSPNQAGKTLYEPFRGRRGTERGSEATSVGGVL